MGMNRGFVRKGGLQMPAGAGDTTFDNHKPVSITTVGAGTITAAAVASGCVLRTGPTGAVADTFDTAANVAAALPDMEIGDSFLIHYSNQVGFIITITGVSGITVSGTPAIAANTMKQILFTKTGAATFTAVCL